MASGVAAMRRFATTPMLLLCVGLALAGIAYAIPEWTRKRGLDFWHLGNETDELRTVTARSHHLNAFNETEIQRRDVCKNIAIALIERRATLAESVAAILAVASDSPEWFATVVTIYRTNQLVGPMATERDVAKRYLLVKLEAMRATAECRGDLLQARAISVRLVELSEELQLDTTLSH